MVKILGYIKKLIGFVVKLRSKILDQSKFSVKKLCWINIYSVTITNYFESKVNWLVIKIFDVFVKMKI